MARRGYGVGKVRVFRERVAWVGWVWVSGWSRLGFFATEAQRIFLLPPRSLSCFEYIEDLTEWGYEVYGDSEACVGVVRRC